MYDIKTIVFDGREVVINFDKDTNDYIIIAPQETITKCRTIYSEGFAQMTLGEFIWKMLGNLPADKE
jgi:hypothetical protein